METEGEKYIVSSYAFVPGIEVAFGHREGVTQVEGAVHVGVGECLEKLRLLVRLSHEVLVTLPYKSGPTLQRYQFVSSSGVLHARLN